MIFYLIDISFDNIPPWYVYCFWTDDFESQNIVIN